MAVNGKLVHSNDGSKMDLLLNYILFMVQRQIGFHDKAMCM